MDATPASSRRHGLARGFDAGVTILAGLALVSLALEYGFPDETHPISIQWLHGIQWATVGAFVAAQLVRILTAPRRRIAVKEDWVNLVLIGFGAIVLVVQREVARDPLLKAGTLYIMTLQGLILTRMAIEALRFNVALSQSRLHPARLVVLSFLMVIAVGTLLLALPRATHGPGVYTDTPAQQARHVLKCLFTATSATCVTGLTVYDTGRDFTLFGQGVILVLFQLGGLGIMISGTIFGLLLGRRLSLRESLVLQDTLAHETIGHIGRTIKYVCLATLLAEAIGAVALYSMWPASIESTGLRVFHSIFHAVSAFCNAGFALQSDSLIAFRGAWQVYGVIMPLIVIGGLGFPVLENLTRLGWTRMRRIVQAAADRRRGRSPARLNTRPILTLHTKLVLTSTAVLIVVPAVLFWIAETPTRLTARSRISAANQRALDRADPDSMAVMPPGERALAALFQSITTRTAGFNTVTLHEEATSTATHFLMCLLMVVGGSPASTAGGMKTITLAVLILGVVSTLRRRNRIEAFSRTIALPLVRRAAAVVILMGLVVAGFTLILCYTESGSLRQVLFEVVSACGTVGLTTGLTPRLTDIGQALIIAAMFIGRLGPLTLLIALAGQERSARYEYPEESVIIG